MRTCFAAEATRPLAERLLVSTEGLIQRIGADNFCQGKVIHLLYTFQLDTVTNSEGNV